MHNKLKIFLNCFISGLLIIGSVLLMIFNVVLPFNFYLTFAITVAVQIPLFIFWLLKNWKTFYLGVITFISSIILLLLFLFDFESFNGLLVGLFYNFTFYLFVPRKFESKKENKLEYIIILLLFAFLFFIINFHTSYRTIFFISFYLISFIIISSQFIFRNQLVISFLYILLGFIFSIILFLLFTNSVDETISYIGIFAVGLFVITCFVFVWRLSVFSKQKGEFSKITIILFSIVGLVASGFGFLKAKEFIAHSVVENGITYQISEYRTYAVSADSDLEEINLVPRYKDKPLYYAEEVFKNCKNIKKVTISGNIIYEKGYFYSLFSKQEFDGSYYCGGYYVPKSLKFAVLDKVYTTHDLELLNSIEVVEIKGKEPSYLSRGMANNNISKLICDIDMTLNSSFLDSVDTIDVYTKNGVKITNNSPKINVHHSKDGVTEFVDNCVLFDKTLVQTFKQGNDISLCDVDINYLGAKSVNSKNVLLPETITGSDLNWNIATDQENYFKSKNNDYYFVNNFVGDNLNSNSIVIGAGASFMKLSNSVDCINSNVKYISDYAFANNPNLFTISKMNNLLNIGKNAFANCYKLFEFYLNSNLKTIESEAFKNTGLTSIFIPRSVEYIGANAFIGSKIETIYLEAEEIPETFDEAFSNKDDQGNKISISLGATR